MRILSRGDVLGARDLTATTPGQPFGSGIQPMSGGGQLSPGGDVASTSHGAPLTGTNPSATWNCVECGRICEDAEELERHLWDKHQIRPRRRHRDYQ